MTKDEYREAFLVLADPKNIEKTLNLALDIRKFEIDLYWKRATYFWTFLAITLAGYFTLLAAKDLPDAEKAPALVSVSCLGVIFSSAWYFVNRASKFWQENWETHVDLLEDSVIGPLYKTVLSDSKLRFTNLWGAYNFSVSKLNQILSLYVLLFFVLLAATTLYRHYYVGWPPDFLPTTMVVLTPIAVIILWCKGRTGEPMRKVVAKRRNTEIVDKT